MLIEDEEYTEKQNQFWEIKKGGKRMGRQEGWQRNRWIDR